MLPPDVGKKPEKPPIIKMAGYLEKKGRMRVVGVRRWKKRWCVLEGKLLLYFKTQLEYSHHLSPCRGSVNMGLALSVTPRGPCQLQIVTRSQIVIFRTKSKGEQDEWFAALRDAKNGQPSGGVKPKSGKPPVAETRRRLPGRTFAESAETDRGTVNGNRSRHAERRDDKTTFVEVAKRNGFRAVTAYQTSSSSSSSVLRKSESDNRISLYGELRGLVRAETTVAPLMLATPPISDKEPCRSRSLSYESIYFKPQESRTPTESVKSRSCRELTSGKVVVRRVSTRRADEDDDDDDGGGGGVSKRMSRSVSFFQKRRDDSDSDDYDYIEIAGVKQKYSKPMAHIEESAAAMDGPPELPPRHHKNDADDDERTSVVKQSAGDGDRESNVDVTYANDDRKFDLERTTTAENDGESPPPLPVKRKRERNAETERRYEITDGVFVFRNGADQVVYDVPIPHGKLIEHFRRLTVSPAKCLAATTAVVYDDSLEPSLYDATHITPDSLETSTVLPVYKRWSNDSGFNHDEPNSFSPDHTHFEDSLEPVIAMMHHDRKIWQNVPNINSTDYFR